MKKYKLIGLLPAFMLFASSCMKEIDLDYMRPEPKLVLNGLIMSGDSVKVHLTRTWFYTEYEPDVAVKNADIKLYVNGVCKEQLIWKAYEEGLPGYYSMGYANREKIGGYYISSYQPAKGDHIKITAEADGFDGISAETYVPLHTYLKDFKARKFKKEENGFIYTSCDFQITIKDDPDKTDFYLIDMEYTGGYGYGYGYGSGDGDGDGDGYGYGAMPSNWTRYTPDYSADPLFTSHFSALDKILDYDWLSGEYGRAFSDDLINGKEYTIKLKSMNEFGYSPDYLPPDEPPIYYRVNLYTITEEYYRYIKALIDIRDGGGLDSDLSNAGLAEPVRIFSNVKGGVGILGAAVRDSISVLP
jgi:hypothetical protein